MVFLLGGFAMRAAGRIAWMWFLVLYIVLVFLGCFFFEIRIFRWVRVLRKKFLKKVCKKNLVLN